MQDFTPKKILLKKKAKAKEPSASSAINRPQLVGDVVADNLDLDSSYLYQMLMNQPENEPIEIEFSVVVFGYQGIIHLCVEDVVELFKNKILNVLILQHFYM
jgi:hypothetical protein